MQNTELIKIRESLGLTKSDFAKLIGTTSMLIGRMEKGSCAISEKIEEAVKALVAANTVPEEEKPKRKGGRKKKAEAAPAAEAAPVVEEPVAEKEAPIAEEPAPVAEEPVVEEPVVVEEKPKKRTKKKEAPSVTIQSAMGGSISIDEILTRIPDGADDVYIKVEENKAYWVKGADSGFVLLWD